MAKTRFISVVVLLTSLLSFASVQAQTTFSRPIPIHPVWSPDGQSIAYRSNGGFYVMDRDGHNARQITPQGGFERWTPDSQALILNTGYSAGNNGLWLYPIDGSEPQRILAEFYNLNRLSYSPDGKKIALTGRKTVINFLGIWIADVDVTGTISSPILLVDTALNDYYVGGIQWTETVDELRLIAWHKSTYKLTHIYLAVNQPVQALDQAKIETLHAEDTFYLNGGWQVVFDPEQSSPLNAYASTTIHHPDHGSIPFNRLITVYINLSPDQQALVYTAYCNPDEVLDFVASDEVWSFDKTFETSVYTLDLTTGTETIIFPCGHGSQVVPSFSPDGTSILFAAVDDSGGRIYRVDLLIDGSFILIDITPEPNPTSG